MGALSLNIGLLIIATGKYDRFVQPLINSCNRSFLRGHNIHYFVFTDSNKVFFENIHIIFQKKLGWPFDTLMRYSLFYENLDKFKGIDYIYYIDADMIIEDEVGEEVLGEFVVVKHPGFFNKPRNLFTYETNPESHAYIAPNEGLHYYAGGFNGGNKDHFINMSKIIKDKIYDDLSRNIIAIWHDESHLNRYAIDKPPTVILDPGYCYPESASLPFRKRLIALDKDHEFMRST